ncbi:MAG: 5'-3' exonuclease H3TH domain-containing protein [Patescibacteria group bacterium]
MSKLILIDGNAILHRAFHALPPLTTKRGEPINAVYGLISMLLRVIQDLKPTHISVCFDEKEPTFRHKEFAAYQAQRPPMANELSGQFEKARKVVEAFGIPIYSKPGYEADDVLGTLARQSKEGVVIVTGDRDILQLVDDKVKVYLPIVGLSSAKLMGKDEVIEKMGVAPSQIADYKALVGDPSDNYPGVAGIGPKTAISLLEKYKNLDGIYAHLKEISPSVREKIAKGKDDSKLSLRLATIVKDVPVELDIEACGKWDIDSQKVLDLFSEFGFKTLTERVKKVGKGIDFEKQMTLI